VADYSLSRRDSKLLNTVHLSKCEQIRGQADAKKGRSWLAPAFSRERILQVDLAAQKAGETNYSGAEEQEAAGLRHGSS
jgi:hypothetical protein